MIDFSVRNEGSLFMLWPHTAAARTWVNEHLPDDRQTLGPRIAIEHRYIGAIVDGIVNDGLTVERG